MQRSQRGSFGWRIAVKRAMSHRTLLEILNIIDKRLLLITRSKLLTALQWLMNGGKKPTLLENLAYLVYFKLSDKINCEI